MSFFKNLGRNIGTPPPKKKKKKKEEEERERTTKSIKFKNKKNKKYEK
jgi:hypothetical protein